MFDLVIVRAIHDLLMASFCEVILHSCPQLKAVFSLASRRLKLLRMHAIGHAGHTIVFP